MVSSISALRVFTTFVSKRRLAHGECGDKVSSGTRRHPGLTSVLVYPDCIKQDPYGYVLYMVHFNCLRNVLCVLACACYVMHVVSEDNWQELVLSFCRVGSGYQSQVIDLNSTFTPEPSHRPSCF